MKPLQRAWGSVHRYCDEHECTVGGCLEPNVDAQGFHQETCDAHSPEAMCAWRRNRAWERSREPILGERGVSRYCIGHTCQVDGCWGSGDIKREGICMCVRHSMRYDQRGYI